MSITTLTNDRSIANQSKFASFSAGAYIFQGSVAQRHQTQVFNLPEMNAPIKLRQIGRNGETHVINAGILGQFNNGIVVLNVSRVQWSCVLICACHNDNIKWSENEPFFARFHSLGIIICFARVHLNDFFALRWLMRDFGSPPALPLKRWSKNWSLICEFSGATYPWLSRHFCPFTVWREYWIVEWLVLQIDFR